ncbi:MAG: TonB family protein [Saprospirales bacterium]|nr:MAG: TonB family protein [Saprospirales bacterium]
MNNFFDKKWMTSLDGPISKCTTPHITFLLIISSSLFLMSCGGTHAYMISGGSEYPRFPGKFAEFLGDGEKEVLTTYHFVVSKAAENHFIKRTFFPETNQMTDIEHFADSSLLVKIGMHLSFYDDGNPMSEINYVNNRKDGLAVYYHPFSGQTISTGQYGSGNRNGIWREYSGDGMLLAKYEYAAGMREGPFKEWTPEGELIKKGHYKGGLRQVEFSLPDTAITTIEMPVLKECAHLIDLDERSQCSDRAFLRYVYQRISYPRTAREYGIEGNALVKFVITPDGRLDDINCLRCLSMDIKAEILSIVDKLPEWSPGKRKGIPVSVSFRMPIRFELN